MKELKNNEKNPATDASHLKARRDDFVFGRSWRGDETNLYSNDPEGVTRRSILFAILKDLRFDLGNLRSWRGDETTFIPAIRQGLRDDLRF